MHARAKHAEKTKSIDGHDWPLVSVIMPVRNEARFIRRSLMSVLAQDYPPDRLEVIVVDGMSDDGTPAIVEEVFAAFLDSCNLKHNLPKEIRQARYFTMKLLKNPSLIAPAALNIGLREAQGEIIIRVDGHCEIAPDYVLRCIKALDETGADCVGGLQRSEAITLKGRAIVLATSSRFGIGNARFRYEKRPQWADTVYLGAYRRKVFEHVGKFDEELVRNQDDEFNFRLIQHGGRIWLDPGIRSVYYSRSTFRGLWRQYFQYGFYKVRVIQKRRGIASWRHLVPGVFVSILGCSALVSVFTGQAVWFLSVATPYVLAALSASISSARKDWKVLPFLPVAYAILHLSYGSGFLLGLVYWGRRPISHK